MPRTYDILCMGRSSIDLYSNDVGAPFEEITSFAALVGGCPTNISVGTRRLGAKSALMTAVGDDKVGDFELFVLVRKTENYFCVPHRELIRFNQLLDLQGEIHKTHDIGDR